ncbi:MAG: biopolymer transporter ExbD [Acetobacter sp.]|nr:biopolymer transporter ExbD [Acetobacter sp.]
MSIHLSSDNNDGDEVVSAINVTPLVDIMLVLLIIFLITIPVAIHTVKVNLPRDVNQPTKTKLRNVVIAVTPDGHIWWNQTMVQGQAQLEGLLEKVALIRPQPQIQIRGDKDAKYESVGQIVAACQQAGIYKLNFITEKPKG